jgi:transposase-like protein
MTTPEVAVGDGALGFWAALSDVFPSTREQRCWVHKIANILDALPKRLHRSAKAALHEIYQAETRVDAEAGIDRFARQFGDKYPKAVDKLIRDRDVLLTFYDFPAAHWTHLRTVNPIESTFATVRLRTRVTKGAGSRRRGLMMAYKLLDAAQARWRKVNSPELVALVRAGVEFRDGIQIERSIEDSRDAA